MINGNSSLRTLFFIGSFCKFFYIFDRFRMGDDTHNRLHEGMGVGLFICKKLIELLGGEIEVRSEKNTGSYFSFYLPLQKNKQIF